MLHSDGGVGDHGENGIERFVQTHICNTICAGFGFRSLKSKKEARSRIRAQHAIDQYETDSEEEETWNSTKGGGPQGCTIHIV